MRLAYRTGFPPCTECCASLPELNFIAELQGTFLTIELGKQFSIRDLASMHVFKRCCQDAHE